MEFRVNEMEMILICEIFGQAVNYLYGSDLRKAFHTAAVISFIGLKNFRSFCDINYLLATASSTIVSQKGSINRGLLRRKRRKRDLYLRGLTVVYCGARKKDNNRSFQHIYFQRPSWHRT